jgi:hypothetical protein
MPRAKACVTALACGSVTTDSSNEAVGFADELPRVRHRFIG